MNVQSNAYTFIYASVMVIIVAAILSFTAVQLQPEYDKNVEIEKKQNILTSVEVESTPENAETLYDQYIKNSYVVDINGKKKDGIDAFSVDLKVEQAKKEENQSFPVFECEKEGKTYYVFPLLGKGLWGPLWGYIALKDDFNTIYGATFDHKGETPGLGAEISTSWFQEPFKDEKLFNDKGKFVSITVKKGGGSDPENKHEVDGISGGTITSKGLEAMIFNCMKNYEAYFKSKK